MKSKLNRLFSILISASFLMLLAACGKSVEAHWQEQYDLGEKYLSELNYDQALMAFSKAIEIDEKQVDAYLGRAQVYLHQENYEAAIADYTSALAIDADQSELYILRGDAYAELASEADEPTRTDSLNRAGRDYEQAIDKMGLTWELFIKLSDIYKQTDESKLSDLIEKALENFGDTDELANWLQENGYYLTDAGTAEPIDLGGYLGQFESVHSGYAAINGEEPDRGSEFDFFVETEKRRQLLAPIDQIVSEAIEEENDDIRTYGDKLSVMYYMAGELETAREIRTILYNQSGDEIYNPDNHVIYNTNYGMSTSYFNGYGCITREVWASANATCTYDEKSRTISRIYDNDYSHIESVYEYDDKGRIARLTVTNTVNGHYSQDIYSYEYDGNVVTKKWMPYGASESYTSEIYYIDDYGFVTKIDLFGTD